MKKQKCKKNTTTQEENPPASPEAAPCKFW